MLPGFHIYLLNRQCHITIAKSQYKHPLVIGAHTKSFMKYVVNKTELMLYKPLFIIHVRVIGLLKDIIKMKCLSYKTSILHVNRDFINARFQVSVQITAAQ